MLTISPRPLATFNSFGPSDAIWRWRSWSTLIQVMAWCLTAPNHYLNQCWLIINKVLWHSSQDIIIRRLEDTNQWSKAEDYIFKITLRSLSGQWVNTRFDNCIVITSYTLTVMFEFFAEVISRKSVTTSKILLKKIIGKYSVANHQCIAFNTPLFQTW